MDKEALDQTRANHKTNTGQDENAKVRGKVNGTKRARSVYALVSQSISSCSERLDNFPVEH